MSKQANTIVFESKGKNAQATTLDKPVRKIALVGGKSAYGQTDLLNEGLYNIPSGKNATSFNTWRVTTGVTAPVASKPKANKNVMQLANSFAKLSADDKTALVAILSAK